jgi:1,4-dihydroxy-2-naphthoate octaprenyltransferase
VLITLFYILYSGTDIKWAVLPFVIIGVLSLHGSVNLTNEYFDYRNGVDRPETKQNSRGVHVLPGNPLLAQEVLNLALVLSGVAVLSLAAVFFIQRYIPVLVIGGLGLVTGIFYTTPPLEYKYRALGDVTIFIMMGPALFLGSYAALTGELEAGAGLTALPIAFLITAVLHSNNTRDIRKDGSVGVVTVAGMLGPKKSRIYYDILVLGSYLSLAFLVILRVLPWISLAVFLTLPLAVQNIRHMHGYKKEAMGRIDLHTMKLYLLTGVLLILSLAAGRIF